MPLGWNYIEIDLTNQQQQSSMEDIGARLEQQFRIASTCWVKSVSGTIPTLEEDDDPSVPNVAHNLPLPLDLRYPVFNTALPKSGTSTLDVKREFTTIVG